MTPITQQDLKEFCAQRYGNQAWLSRKSGYGTAGIATFLHHGYGLSERARGILAQTIAQHGHQRMEVGGRFFEGKPCRSCGGTLRYRANSRCVPCHLKRCQEEHQRTKQGESKQ